jgi:RHS repeat-associated protein
MFRGNRYYNLHSDHLGTPRLVKDDQAKPVWQWAYSAFGDNKPTGILKATTNPNSAITNQPVLLNATNPSVIVNLRMPGQTYDSETGTFQNYFRDYDPLTGRYRQPDPIGLDGGSNRQIYSDANPLIKSDPTGLFPDSVTAACRTNPILCAEINGPKPVPIPVPIPITKKGDLEACEKDADDQLDRDYAYCKALGATYNDYRTRKACEEKAIAKYVARLKQCKKECK